MALHEEKVCPNCGIVSKALHLHMRKHDGENANENKSALVEFATKNSVELLEKSMIQLANLVKVAIDKIDESSRKQSPVTINPESSFKGGTEVLDAPPDKDHVPPKWRELVRQQLGEKVGIQVVYPDTGSGFLFKLHIPRELSNAPKSYWDMYHHDIRTKAIGYAEGVEGIKKFVLLVKRNLAKSRSESIE